MSKCNSIPRAEITSISNFNVIHICAIKTCVRDWEGLLSWAVLLCNNLCMKSRYHNFILFGIQENIRRRISSNYSYLFVNSENKSKNCYCWSFNERSSVEENMQALINLKFGENISFQVQSSCKKIWLNQNISKDLTRLHRTQWDLMHAKAILPCEMYSNYGRQGKMCTYTCHTISTGQKIQPFPSLFTTNPTTTPTKQWLSTFCPILKPLLQGDHVGPMSYMFLTT